MKLIDRLRARLVRQLRDHGNVPLPQRILGALFLRYAPYQLTCAEFERFVLDYHEGLLSPRQRARFEFHMRICPMCDVHFQSYVKAVRMGQRLHADEDADRQVALPEELVAAIVASRRS